MYSCMYARALLTLDMAAVTFLQVDSFHHIHTNTKIHTLRIIMLNYHVPCTYVCSIEGHILQMIWNIQLRVDIMLPAVDTEQFQSPLYIHVIISSRLTFW